LLRSLRLGVVDEETPEGTEMSHDTLSGPHYRSGATGGLQAVAAQICEQVAAYCESTKVPGYVAGVYHDGAQIVAAHGLANVVTGAPMGGDIGFLFGSVTKVLTATLVLRQVERGVIDLAEPVIKYLPEFQLSAPGRPKRSASGIC
jgi:CubicO group peptidase (beta-lactamase class C family)